MVMASSGLLTTWSIWLKLVAAWHAMPLRASVKQQMSQLYASLESPLLALYQQSLAHINLQSARKSMIVNYNQVVCVGRANFGIILFGMMMIWSVAAVTSAPIPLAGIKINCTPLRHPIRSTKNGTHRSVTACRDATMRMLSKNSENQKDDPT